MRKRSTYVKERIAELRAKHGTRRKKLVLKPRPVTTIKGRWTR